MSNTKTPLIILNSPAKRTPEGGQEKGDLLRNIQIRSVF
jgi:hypothetical protein